MNAHAPTRLIGPQQLFAMGYGQPHRRNARAEDEGKASPVITRFDGIQSKKNKPNRRAATTPGMARIRELVYPYVHGEKTIDGVKPSITIANLIHRWNGGRIHTVPKLANYDLADHAKGEATYYYFGTTTGRYMMPLIDIDVDKSKGLGTPEGARDFADYLHQQVIPGCHWEDSTNGKGQHGYPLIDLGEDYKHVTVQERKAILRKMQDDLRKVAARYGADIELVEVKGHPPVIQSYQRHQARGTAVIDSMTYGTFAKLPRDIEALASLQPVCLDRLAELAAEVPAHPRVMGKPVGMTSSGGSCSGKCIGEDMLDMLPDLEREAEALLAGRMIMAGAAKVTAHDLAVTMLLCWAFGNDPGNPDHAMPTARFKGMWDALYKAGDIRRGWQASRFIACRNLLADEGFIRVIDGTYFHKEGGGRCCRWHLTEELTARLDRLHAVRLAGPAAAEEGEASPVISPLAELPRTGDAWRPIRLSAGMRTPPRPEKTFLHEYSLAA